MKTILTIITTICMWQISNAQSVPLDSVQYCEGKTITVCAKVQGTYVTQGNSKTTYLNFGAPYPNTTFTGVIFASSMAYFNYIPAEHLKDKSVCITGQVEMYKGKPQIILKNEEQIKIQN